jgi:catechol 2,3-dioxygenase-like lactoylglutathione lyase family enzyme
MHPHGVLETCLYAEDLAAAERFYRNVLGLEFFARDAGRHVFFRCGGGMFLVFNPRHTTTSEHLVAGSAMLPHGAFGAGHVAFRVTESELDPWRQRLHDHGVPIESEIAWPQGGHSIYFRDPAGNLLELATPKLWGLPDSEPSDL